MGQVLKKPIVAHVVKKLSDFYGTQRFTTMFNDPIMCQMDPVQTSHLISSRYNLTLSSHKMPMSPKLSLSFRFSDYISARICPTSATCLTHLIILDLVTLIIIFAGLNS